MRNTCSICGAHTGITAFRDGYICRECLKYIKDVEIFNTQR